MKVVNSQLTGSRTGWILVFHEDLYWCITVSIQREGQIHFSFRHPEAFSQAKGNGIVAKLQARVPFDVDDLRFAA